jgi:hypothetical protein
VLAAIGGGLIVPLSIVYLSGLTDVPPVLLGTVLGAANDQSVCNFQADGACSNRRTPGSARLVEPTHTQIARYAVQCAAARISEASATTSGIQRASDLTSTRASAGSANRTSPTCSPSAGLVGRPHTEHRIAP